MNTGKRLREIREKRGLTQEEVGKMISKTRSTINRYENSKIEKLDLKTIEELSIGLNVSPYYLAGWTDDEYTIIKNNPKSNITDNNNIILNEKEIKIIKSYRVLPSIQAAVDLLLRLDTDFSSEWFFEKPKGGSNLKAAQYKYKQYKYKGEEEIPLSKEEVQHALDKDSEDLNF